MNSKIDLSRYERLMYERDAAEYLGVSKAWMQKARFNGTGPKYIKVGGTYGRAVRYRGRDLDAYIDANEVSTIDSDGAVT